VWVVSVFAYLALTWQGIFEAQWPLATIPLFAFGSLSAIVNATSLAAAPREWIRHANWFFALFSIVAPFIWLLAHMAKT
jgi:hypothetical protein